MGANLSNKNKFLVQRNLGVSYLALSNDILRDVNVSKNKNLRGSTMGLDLMTA